jgi:multidrug transporter EmrE-like cation transporter
MITFAFDLPLLLWLLVAIVLPILVGLVTTKTTSPGRKAIYLAALALVAGLLTQLLAAINAGVTYDLFAGLIQGIGTFLVATAGYYGFWKPTGVTAAAQAVGAPKHSA